MGSRIERRSVKIVAARFAPSTGDFKAGCWKAGWVRRPLLICVRLSVPGQLKAGAARGGAGLDEELSAVTLEMMRI
jgi:hypothetical protein